MLHINPNHEQNQLQNSNSVPLNHELDNTTRSSSSSSTIQAATHDKETGSNTISFPTPFAEEGMQSQVIIINKAKAGRIFRTRALVNSQNPNFAYIENQHKPRVPTNMGYIMFCYCIPRAHHKRGLIFEVPQDNEVQAVAIKLCCWKKIIDFREAGKAEDPLQEVGAIQFLAEDNHQHVLGCHEVLCDDDYMYTIMPYCPNSDLLSLIYDGTMGGLPESVARYIFRRMIENLQYLKDRGVVHRDISSENIMFDREGRCLFIDMGMAKRVPDGMKGERRAMLAPEKRCGKYPYMAPEIHASKVAYDGYGVDLWSSAVVLYSMLTGENKYSIDDGCRILYHQAHKEDAVFRILTRPDNRGLESLLSDWDVTMSEDAVDLLQSVFQLDPLDRPTLEDVMKHPWVNNPDVVTHDEFMAFLSRKRN